MSFVLADIGGEVAAWSTLVVGLVGAGGIGALVKGWWDHSTEVDGRFTERSSSRRDDFQLLNDRLTKRLDEAFAYIDKQAELRRQDAERIDHLEDANRKCEQENLARQREIDELRSRLKHGSVVLIEDSPADERIVSAILEPLRLEITTVRDLEAAQKYVRPGSGTRLVIADVLLNGGEDEVGRLKELIDAACCPVVVHTGMEIEGKPFGDTVVVPKWDAKMLLRVAQEKLLESE